MKILILGAGRVGESVAESLVSERNDITVVDSDPVKLRALQDRLDLRGVVGNGIQPSVLAEAGAEDTDLLIACAPMDETNLVACKVAKQRFNVPTAVARVRSPEFVDGGELMGRDGFAVDHLLCPEQTVTAYIRKLVEYPEALQVLEFAHGLVSLIAVRAVAGGPLVQHSLAEIPALVPGADMRIVAIYRQDQALTDLSGSTRIGAGVLLAGHKKDVVISNRLDSHPGRIAIYGWHMANGQPIQPLSTAHGIEYVDYSHGIRLVSDVMLLNGEVTSVHKVLANARLAAVLSDEGPVASLARYIPERRRHVAGVQSAKLTMLGR